MCGKLTQVEKDVIEAGLMIAVKTSAKDKNVPLTSVLLPVMMVIEKVQAL